MSHPTAPIDVAPSQAGHVLLVCPLTFSYHVAITEVLQAMGHSVTWWNDKASTSTAYKLALRLMPGITRQLTESHYLKLIDALPHAPQHILIIKGEGLTEKVVHRLRERFPQASIGLYLWDGVENVKGAERLAPLFHAVSTFDPVDAQRFGWRYRPLFARKVALSATPSVAKDFDWCFIGTVHSDRHQVIHRLRSHYAQQMRCFVFAYFQSPLVLALRKLGDRTLWSAPPGTLSTASMDPKDVAQVVARSRAVLDVEHPRQRGFTMRTIETLLAGKKLITTNQHLLSSDLYDASRACLIDREAPRISREFLDKPVTPVAAELHERYSCAGWARELLDLQIAGQRRDASLNSPPQ